MPVTNKLASFLYQTSVLYRLYLFIRQAIKLAHHTLTNSHHSGRFVFKYCKATDAAFTIFSHIYTLVILCKVNANPLILNSYRIFRPKKIATRLYRHMRSVITSVKSPPHYSQKNTISIHRVEAQQKNIHQKNKKYLIKILHKQNNLFTFAARTVNYDFFCLQLTYE